MLEFPNLQRKYKLVYFQYGLQSWAYNELKWRSVLDIDEAIDVTEDLIEFRREDPVWKPSGGDRTTPRLQQREDKHANMLSNFKGKVIDGGTEGR